MINKLGTNHFWFLPKLYNHWLWDKDKDSQVPKEKGEDPTNGYIPNPFITERSYLSMEEDGSGK